MGVSTVYSQDMRTATHYGTEYNGNSMSCPNAPRYSSDNINIAALSYSDKDRWPCGTTLVVSGPVVSIEVTVMDTCGGCGPRNMIDLSEAGIIAVCGSLGGCTVEVYKEERKNAGN